jgi:hypothetical protein
MSEKERRGERTRREAEGRRMDHMRAHDGPRRVGAERESREESVRHETQHHEDGYQGTANDRGTS